MPETQKKSPFYSQGLYFACKRCSACCRFDSGYVFLSEKDVSLLLAELNITQEKFIDLYCRWVPSENGKFELSLMEKSNYDCIFWEAVPGTGIAENSGGGCSVYRARPLQCRAFPFWSSIVCNKIAWEVTGRNCPGMDKDVFHTGDSIEKWLAQRQNEPIMSKGVC